MDKLVIDGIPPYDGEYEFDLVDLIGSLTNRELHRIKTMSGVRAGELFEALGAGDNDLIVAITMILLGRRGRRVDEDLLWDAPAGAAISMDIEEREEADDGPPAKASATKSPRRSSGGSSTPTSARPGNGQSPTGIPGSGTPSPAPGYDPATSAT